MIGELLGILSNQTWMKGAACGPEVDHLFFPPDGMHGRWSWKPARTICDTCPVKHQCLDWGMDTDDGMFGGKTPAERALMREAGAA